MREEGRSKKGLQVRISVGEQSSWRRSALEGKGSKE